MEREGRGGEGAKRGCRRGGHSLPAPTRCLLPSAPHTAPQPPQPPHLLVRLQLQQSAAEGGAGVELLELEEDGHGGAQAERQVHALQVAVREVGGQLRGATRVVPDLPPLQLDAQRDVVVPAGGRGARGWVVVGGRAGVGGARTAHAGPLASHQHAATLSHAHTSTDTTTAEQPHPHPPSPHDGHQLLHLVRLLAAAHHQQRDDVQDGVEQAQSLAAGGGGGGWVGGVGGRRRTRRWAGQPRAAAGCGASTAAGQGHGWWHYNPAQAAPHPAAQRWPRTLHNTATPAPHPSQHPPTPLHHQHPTSSRTRRTTTSTAASTALT